MTLPRLTQNGNATEYLYIQKREEEGQFDLHFLVFTVAELSRAPHSSSSEAARASFGSKVHERGRPISRQSGVTRGSALTGPVSRCQSSLGLVQAK
ncbi:hypothetical protein J6590_000475 [Homalodisca vitripennis]|nr:hypothetical protein J6590_000475 [Homalodisca vitripennis]